MKKSLVVLLLFISLFALCGVSNVAFASSTTLPTGIRQLRPVVKQDYEMAMSSKFRAVNKAVSAAKLSKTSLSQKFYVFKYTEVSGDSAQTETYYYIGSMLSGYYLADVNNKLIQQKGVINSPASNQLWSAAKNSYGYTLQNKATGKYITLAGNDLSMALKKSGKAAKAQSFKSTATTYKTRAYRVYSFNGKVLEISSKKTAKNVSAILAKPKQTENSQRLSFAATGGSVKISRALTSRYLPTVRIIPTGDGYFFFSNGSSSYLSCADLEVGAKVSLAQVSTLGENQKFRIYASSYYSTGNTQLDNKINKILKKQKVTTSNLRKLYNYVCKYHYRGAGGKPHPRGNWENKYTLNMIKHKGGNCYSYAVLLATLAKASGHKANVQLGYVKTRGGRAPHGWVEIAKSGKIYICDPERARATSLSPYYMKRYSKAPLIYIQS